MKSKIKKKNYFVFEGLTFRLFSCDFRIVDSGDAFINYNAIDISSLSSDC